MDHIIDAIKEYRQKLLVKKLSEVDFRIIRFIDDYLSKAQDNMNQAKMMVEEHKIEL